MRRTIASVVEGWRRTLPQSTLDVVLCGKVKPVPITVLEVLGDGLLTEQPGGGDPVVIPFTAIAIITPTPSHSTT